MRIRLTAFVAIIALLIPQIAPAAEELSQDAALKWLQKMGQALHELNYDGVFVYQHGDQLTAMRLIHGHDDLGEQERLVSLTGTSREVIRNNDQVTCILPDTRSVIVERKGQSKPGFPYLLPKQIKQINRSAMSIASNWAMSVASPAVMPSRYASCPRIPTVTAITCGWTRIPACC